MKEEILVLIIMIGLTVLMTIIFGWGYIFLSASFVFGWLSRAFFDAME